MSRLLPSFLTVIVGLSLVSYSVVAQAPIPGRPPGFVYKTSPEDVPVHLEAWVSLMCPYAKVQWPLYQEVADYYGADKVRFDGLMFPLPYHRAAMAGSQVR